MTASILRTISEVLKTKVDMYTSQKNCSKWDSLAQIHIMIALEDEFGITFQPEDFARMTDIRSIDRKIKNKILIEQA